MNCAIVDVFADRPFSGNPAGVVLLDEPGETGWMQRIAAELGQAATAFLHGDHLRWFSTTVELEICGHGTAATAHLLFERGLATGRVSFDTAAGPLAATRRDGLIELDFPAAPTRPAAVGGAEALGLAIVATGRSHLDAIVEVATAAEVSAWEPDQDALAAVEARGVILTAPADDGQHAIVSRFFAPRRGISEDPATGSAHCALATWWAPRVGECFRARQASARGATIEVALESDRVRLAGPCRTVLDGRLAS
jgi:PhzF family phenazine biosynthesis protein